jgi:hypothetical protein
VNGPAPFALTVVSAAFGAVAILAAQIGVLWVCFEAFGVDAGLALAAILGCRVFQYRLPIIPGVLAYLQLLRTVRDWDKREITQGV